jgi:hypothetical protein
MSVRAQSDVQQYTAWSLVCYLEGALWMSCSHHSLHSLTDLVGHLDCFPPQGAAVCAPGVQPTLGIPISASHYTISDQGST